MTQHNTTQHNTLDIALPPCPAVLVNIQQEMGRPQPNLHKIAEHIARDVLLTAEVLKTVNSPFYGLRNKLGSIPDAIRMLGLDRIYPLVTAVSLRHNVPLEKNLECFWRDAATLGILNASIAKVLRFDPDMAYLMGLFHDSAVPLMTAKFPDYFLRLREFHGDNLDISLAEDRIFNTNHALLGSLMARSWHLPEQLVLAVRFHHSDELFTQGLGSKALSLITVNLLADSVNDYICGNLNIHFEQLENQVRDYLSLSDDNAYQRVIDAALDAVHQ